MKVILVIQQDLLRYLEDMEDIYLAIDRIENPGERVSMEDVKKILDVEGSNQKS